MVRLALSMTLSASYSLLYTRFKLFLEPTVLRNAATVDPRLPQIPVCIHHYHIEIVTYVAARYQLGKKPLDLIVDFLSCLWEYAKEQITREIGAVADLSKFLVKAIYISLFTQT